MPALPLHPSSDNNEGYANPIRREPCPDRKVDKMKQNKNTRIQQEAKNT